MFQQDNDKLFNCVLVFHAVLLKFSNETLKRTVLMFCMDVFILFSTVKETLPLTSKLIMLTLFMQTFFVKLQLSITPGSM